MQVQYININNQTFNGIKIKSSAQYKSLNHFCKVNKYKEFLQLLDRECKQLEGINMDLYIYEGENYPKYLEEIKDEVIVENRELYNETIEKIFGRKKYSADVLISPSDYISENSKKPMRYSVPSLHITGNYIADKWAKKLPYRTYPQSKDPKYKFCYSHFDIPSSEMILDIKKKIFNSIIESNVLLANKTKHL